TRADAEENNRSVVVASHCFAHPIWSSKGRAPHPNPLPWVQGRGQWSYHRSHGSAADRPVSLGDYGAPARGAGAGAGGGAGGGEDDAGAAGDFARRAAVGGPSERGHA